MEIITSKSNEKVKYIKSLNEKKFRDKTHTFYLEGIKVINEILDNKAIDILFIAYSHEILVELNGGINLENRLDSTSINLVSLSKEVFLSITDTVTPQGVLAVIQKPEYSLKDEISNYNNNILVIDKVQDSGNLGTIIRSADSFGVNLVICIKGTTDIYSPKVIRSTMGSITRVKVIYIDELSELDILTKNNFVLVSTTLNSTKYIEELDYSKKYAFILGNEANGVSQELQDMSQEKIKIKMLNTAESLNVSIAASIVLYEQFKNKEK